MIPVTYVHTPTNLNPNKVRDYIANNPDDAKKFIDMFDGKIVFVTSTGIYCIRL